MCMLVRRCTAHTYMPARTFVRACVCRCGPVHVCACVCVCTRVRACNPRGPWAVNTCESFFGCSTMPLLIYDDMQPLASICARALGNHVWRSFAANDCELHKHTDKQAHTCTRAHSSDSYFLFRCPSNGCMKYQSTVHRTRAPAGLASPPSEPSMRTCTHSHTASPYHKPSGTLNLWLTLGGNPPFIPQPALCRSTRFGSRLPGRDCRGEVVGRLPNLAPAAAWSCLRWNAGCARMAPAAWPAMLAKDCGRD